MSKRTVFTTVTPLPAGVTRKIVLDFLHDHEEMIDLNPLVKERHPIPMPPHATADELDCQWFSLTDKISYFPGLAGDVTYTCAFHHLSNGLQTHCYAPAGLTIRDKWTVGGALPGEPAQPVELGLKMPPIGLYLREDVDIRCNVIMASFVKKTLKKSHAALVERLKIKAEIASSNNSGGVPKPSNSTTTRSTASGASSVSSHPSHLSVSTPNSRPSSAASSAASSSGASSAFSAASSPSVPSIQTTPSWSSAVSSAATSPATSPKSPQPPYQKPRYQQQRQWQRRPGDNAPSPTSSVPRTASIPTIPSRAPLEVPDTPFLSYNRPDWPDWPLKVTTTAPKHQKQRPQSELFTSYTYMYTSPVQDRSQERSQQVPRKKVFIPYTTTTCSTTPRESRSSNGALSDDALWQALGGGSSRFSFVGASSSVSASAASSSTSVSGSGMGVNYEANRNTNGNTKDRGHPDYPYMSPYDDEEEDDSDESQDAGVNVPACLGVGRGVAARPVSMPPAPLRTGRERFTGAGGRVGGSWVAELC